MSKKKRKTLEEAKETVAQLQQQESPSIQEAPPPLTPLQELIVNYVGEKLKPEDNEINLKMVVEVIAEEFPEIIYIVAENNFMIGYNKALDDVREVHDKAAAEKNGVKAESDEPTKQDLNDIEQELEKEQEDAE